MTIRTHVVADDLTGAAESGIMLHHNGFRTVIAMDSPGEGWRSSLTGPSSPATGGVPVPDDFDAVVWASELRAANNMVARAATADHLSSLLDAPRRDAGQASTVVLKVDSLLRGPLPGLLAGVRASHPNARVVVAPALPLLERTTLDGVQYLRGVPLAETDAWHLEPGVPPASVAEAFGVGADLPWLRIADARDTADLEELVRRETDAGGQVVWIGSAALVRAVASYLRAGPEDPGHVAGVGTITGRALSVIGSGAPESAAQAERLVESGARCFTFDAAELAAGRLSSVALTSALDQQDVVVRISGAALLDESPLIAAQLAQLVSPAARSANLLILTGGHTARTVLGSIGVAGLIPLSEPRPGVVLSRVVPGSGYRHTGDAPQHVITKAGSFGEPTTLAHAAQAVRTQGVTR